MLIGRSSIPTPPQEIKRQSTAASASSKNGAHSSTNLVYSVPFHCRYPSGAGMSFEIRWLLASTQKPTASSGCPVSLEKAATSARWVSEGPGGTNRSMSAIVHASRMSPASPTRLILAVSNSGAKSARTSRSWSTLGSEVDAAEAVGVAEEVGAAEAGASRPASRGLASSPSEQATRVTAASAIARCASRIESTAHPSTHLFRVSVPATRGSWCSLTHA